MTKDELLRKFIKAVKNAKENKMGTYYWALPIEDSKNNWAIVLGYSDGFDETEQDEFTDGTRRLCAKFAFQPNNSIMQCDYDVDWLQPYDEATGDVDDREVSIYPEANLKRIVDWLWKQYEEYKYVFETEGLGEVC